MISFRGMAKETVLKRIDVLRGGAREDTEERRWLRDAAGWAQASVWRGMFGGPDRDRTDDLFHAMTVARRDVIHSKGPVGYGNPRKTLESTHDSGFGTLTETLARLAVNRTGDLDELSGS